MQNIFSLGFSSLSVEKKVKDMNSEVTPRVLDTLKEEQSMGRSDLESQGQVGSSDAAVQPQTATQENGSSSNFDLTAYDLQAHTLLCAELLNGEGIDRLPQETDAELTARLWTAWNECKFANLKSLFVTVKDLT